MRVLVTIASDGTDDAIGARIGFVLGARGHQVEVRTAAEVISVDSYDIVVLGSALEEGHWRDDARGLVLRELADLSARPVWLFSEAADDAGDPTIVDVTDVMGATHAYDHRVFPAAEVDSASRGGTATAVLTPADEDEPWDEVDRWAISIADSISSG